MRRRWSRNPSTACEMGARLAVGGEGVRLVLVDELQPVFDSAQPHVRLVELALRRVIVT